MIPNPTVVNIKDILKYVGLRGLDINMKGPLFLINKQSQGIGLI